MVLFLFEIAQNYWIKCDDNPVVVSFKNKNLQNENKKWNKNQILCKLSFLSFVQTFRANSNEALCVADERQTFLANK